MKGMIVLVIATLIGSASSAKILALMVVASHSHHLWNSKYLEALVARGHHVTYFGIDEYKNKPKNLSHIWAEGIYESLDLDLTSVSEAGAYRNILLLDEWEEMETQALLKNQGTERLRRLVKEEKFDLVVYDVGSGEFLLGAVDALGRPPVVGITAFGVPTWALQILGNPMAYSSKPHFYAPYSDTMTFLQRANNYFLHLFSFAVRWLSARKHNENSKKLFGRDVRPLDQILDDINVMMVNWNSGTDYPFPRVPGLIPVGGLHIQEPKYLPPDLKNFLEEANDGVVYFSLGTNINSSMNKEKIKILMEAFRKIAPVRVLWKMDSDPLQGKPENVKIMKWLPQNDILAHPNVRVFFTHSGLLSTQEAVYHGKPVVGMPFFLDQYGNLWKCIEKGFGEKLDYATLTVEDIVSTLRKVLEDPRYTENARKASVIFRDDIEKPLERAVYWTEYAIRHKGASHLRHAARKLSWYQNWMLDVMILSLGCVFMVFFIIYKSVNVILFKNRVDISKLKTN